MKNLSVSVFIGPIAGLIALVIIQSSFSLGLLISASTLLTLSILLIRRYEFNNKESKQRIVELETQLHEIKGCFQNLSEQKKVFTEQMPHLDRESREYIHNTQQFITNLKNERANYRKACEALQKSHHSLLSEVKEYGR
jgi:flagellar biosynthesis chaperone FliJ